MNKSLKIALAVFMALVLIITIVVFLIIFFTSEKKVDININGVVDINTNQSANVNSEETNVNSEATNTNSRPIIDVDSDAEPFLQQIAKNFAERFGSYSTHSDYENITKLEIYMSTSLKSWAENYVSEQVVNTGTDVEYYGVTTKVISITTDSVGEETAQFTISTQRNESKADELKAALKGADIAVCSIEHGDRFKHRWQDHSIPHKHG